MASGDGNSGDIDEDLHSRQLSLYGRESMRRIFVSNVLVSGMQGLGAEIAKNLILAGVKSVTLHDEGIVELWDLSSNFIFSESDVGQNRALASLQKLQELNNVVTVSTLITKFAKEKLSDFQAVVFTDISLEDAVEFDDYCHCHQPPIAFIKAKVRGLVGSVFCDFGPNFTFIDVDGDKLHTGVIVDITNENPAKVSYVGNERLKFQDGDGVVFSEIRGMKELNDGKRRKIISATPSAFTLDKDTTKFGRYERDGIGTQVKQHKVLNFKPLREALKDPGDFLLSDVLKVNHPPLLHLAFQALDKFRSELGRFPTAGSEDDSQKMISIVNRMSNNLGNAKIEDINKKLLKQVSFGAHAVLNPMAVIFGGIVGQEVLKACSGKFMPLFQFFYFDSVESLPTEALEPSDFAPSNCRCDAQISVFGHNLQNKLQEAKVFLVGSGALGCEFLKNLALMGVACNCQGKLTVTDDDVIAKSNLSTQFLFRNWNIGQAKSTVAAAAAASINPHFHVEALQNCVCSKTENVFNDAFWGDLNVVINAADNVGERFYVGQRCVYFQKHLMESVTFGTKCNTQIVIPHLTDPVEKVPPLCTVLFFPHSIDHCLAWAFIEFGDLLEKTPSEVNAFLSSPDEYRSADASLLKRVLECIGRERQKTFQDCVAWARLKFEEYFANSIKQLTSNVPEDTLSNGKLFWSAPKRFPQPLQFNSNDHSHLDFIMSASILRAKTFGIAVPEWAKLPTKMAEAVDSVPVPEFQPKPVDNEATSPSIEEVTQQLEESRRLLPHNFRMKPIHFGKDDDTNYHMDLIAGLANMRAKNYRIHEADKLEAKLIVGKTAPAVARTTALATGLACLELYKIIDRAHRLEDYRNALVNLALPVFSMTEPSPPDAIMHKGLSWTLWDKWKFTTKDDNPTVRDLILWLAHKGLLLHGIFCEKRLLYNDASAEHRSQMDKRIVDLAREKGVMKFFPPYRCHFDLEVVCFADRTVVIDIPLISIYFR